MTLEELHAKEREILLGKVKEVDGVPVSEIRAKNDKRKAEQLALEAAKYAALNSEEKTPITTILAGEIVTIGGEVEKPKKVAQNPSNGQTGGDQSKTSPTNPAKPPVDPAKPPAG